MKVKGRVSALVQQIHRMRLMRRLCAGLTALALALSPISQFSTVTAAKAGVSGTVADCFDAVFVDSYKTAGDAVGIAADPDFIKCTGELGSSSGSDVFLDAAVVLMTALSFADNYDASQCKSAVRNILAAPLVDALKLLLASGGVISDMISTILGPSATKELMNFATNAAQQDFIDIVTSFLGPLMDDIDCGCVLGGAAVQAAHDFEAQTKDTLSCLGGLADIAEALGKGVVAAVEWLGAQIGDVAGDVEQAAELAYCDTVGAIFGGCSKSKPPPENIGTRTGGALAIACTEGYQFGYETGTQIAYKPTCVCLPGSTLIGNTSKTYCACNDPQKSYGNDGDPLSSGCSVCDGITNPNGSCHQCGVEPANRTTATGTSFEAPAPAGMVYVPDRKNNQCHLTAACTAPEVYDPATNSCSLCAANSAANQSWTIDQYGAVELSLGTCVACPSGTSSAAGSVYCSPLNCSLVQQPDSNGGHSCVACASVGHRLDADVCLDSGGTALYQPAECAWGASLPLGKGQSSPAAYNPADCKPLDCKGTDHPDDDGHACMKCQNVVTMPKEILAGATPVAKMSLGGSTMVGLSNGKVLLFTGGQQRGGTKEVQLTDSDGNSRTVNSGGASSGGGSDTVQVCLDPDNNPAHRPHVQTSSLNVPGVEILRQQPDLQFQDYKPPSAYLIPGNTSLDPGNNPIAPNVDSQGQGVGVSVPMSLPLRPGQVPRPPGGGTSATLPAQRNQGGTSVTLPAQSDKATGARQGERDPVKPKDDGQNGTSVTLPARGDGQSDQRGGTKKVGAGPSRSSKGNKNGYTTTTVPAEGSNDSGDGYITEKMPAHGESDSPPSRSQPRATPKLESGPRSRATPNATPQFDSNPQLGRSGSAAGTVAPRAGSQLERATPQLERTRPTLNAPNRGPSLISPGANTGSAGNPFGGPPPPR